MQMIIVLVLGLTCLITPFVVITDYIRQTSVDAMCALDDAASESLRYAEKTLGFLTKSRTVGGSMAVFLSDESTALQSKLAQGQLCRTLLSISFHNPEFKSLVYITPKGIVTSRGIIGLSKPIAFKNKTQSSLLAYDAFKSYLEAAGSGDSPSRIILFEPVGDEAYAAAAVDFSGAYDKAASGVYVRDETGGLLHSNGDKNLTDFVRLHEKQLFDADGFGLERYGLGLLSHLHLIEDRLYFRAEYSALKTGRRYVNLLDMEDVLRALKRPAVKCVVLCALGQALLAIVLWRLTGAVLRPFVQLNEYASQMAHSEAMVQNINRLMNALRKRRQLQYRVFGVYALTLMPMVALLPLSANSLSSVVTQNVRSAYVDSVRQTAATLSGRVQRYQRQNTSVATDEALQMLILGAETRDRADNDAGLENLLKEHGLHARGVLGACLYGRDGRLTACTRGWAGEDNLSYAILEKLSPKYRFSTVVPDTGEEGTLNMIYAIRSSGLGEGRALYETMGYLVLEMEPVMNYNIDQASDSFLYLYSQDDWALIATPAYMPFRSLIEGMAQSGLIDVRADSDSRVVTVERAIVTRGAYLPSFMNGKDDSDIQVVSAKIEGTDWTLIGATSMLPSVRVGRLLPAVLVFVMLAFVCVMLLVAILFTQGMVRRVRLVERYFESADLEQYGLPERISVNNEIGALAKSMRDSIIRINSLKQAILEQQARQSRLSARKREAEVIALQSQMDSHLISNVFATMKLLLNEGDGKTLMNVIDATGNFLRSGLTHNEYDVPLEKEMMHVKAYLQIQAIRFGEKLRVEWLPFDDALLGCRVPKYLLQPVLENAIKHGMRPRTVLTIRIHVTAGNGRLSVRVSNDGYGLSALEVEMLNRRLEQRKTADHIGLSNVQERIALRYGPPYGLTVSSGQNGLTWVDILLPVSMGEDERNVQSADC